MSVQVGSSYSTSSSAYTAAAATDSKQADTEKAAETTASTAKQTKETYKPDMEKINKMKADLSNNTLAFKQMVYSMMKKQGGVATDAMKSLLEIDKDTQLSAQEAISEDGYWGVNQTAERILDFAKALSGGDPDKIAGLKDAVQKGFDAAAKVWGGKLPDISYQTLNKVMEGFDEWEKSSKAQA